ncbi:MAG: hypothetical protein KDC87_00830 [Planctomycetes bacterium]|nr:hypothetical protein [Planctomycetota bacterium]MCB9871085.1 hypothetical protein [Planctomycetota bacterium]MCB9888277.1 hypothetical protein [Planctomycetota bacterium]
MAKASAQWLTDPLLARMHGAIRAAGPIRSISVDLTTVCNLRCTGCYFFAEGMDRAAEPSDLGAFVASERARGTNFVTVVGGEPSLALDRLKVLYDAFKLSVATNGTRPIPFDGFEDLPIGVAVWGDHATDSALRAAGRRSLFREALEIYRGDPRAFFYYTVAPGHAHEVDSVVDQCVANGNRVLFNFYSDVAGRGGELDHRQGFAAVRTAIERVIARHPSHILMTARLAEVISTGQLFGERWGHASCTSITFDHPANAARIRNGRPFNGHFRAYATDLTTTRRCCTGVDRDCGTCFDTWQHFSWVMLNLRRHAGSLRDFTEWLASSYLFYLINRLVDVAEGVRLLPEIHRRTAELATAGLEPREASANGSPFHPEPHYHDLGLVDPDHP